MYVKISASVNQAQLDKKPSLNRGRMPLWYIHVCQETRTFSADLSKILLSFPKGSPYLDLDSLIQTCQASGNHGPSAAQSSTIKQHTVEFLEHTHTSSHMINIEIAGIVALNERISMLQK